MKYIILHTHTRTHIIYFIVARFILDLHNHTATMFSQPTDIGTKRYTNRMHIGQREAAAVVVKVKLNPTTMISNYSLDIDRI